MDRLAWENRVQYHRDLLRKARIASLGEAVLAARRSKRKPLYMHLVSIYRATLMWVRKQTRTRYNEQPDPIRQPRTVAQADPPMR